MVRLGKLILLALLITALLCGCMPGYQMEYTFQDLTITADSNMMEMTEQIKASGYDFALASGDMVILGLRLPLSDFATDLTAEDYVNLFVESFDRPCTLETKDGLLTFRYTSEDGSYTYLCAAYKGTDAMWLLQAGCSPADYEGSLPVMLTCLKSVKVA